VKIKPPRLKQGDGVGIIAPAGPVEPSEIEPAISLLESHGFKVCLGLHVYERKAYLAGDDEARLADLHEMFRNDEVRLILCARGGYGVHRILENIDYALAKKNPKIILGYSDITALLIALYRKTGLVTFHGPMAKDLGKNENRNLESLLQLVTSDRRITFSLSHGKVIWPGKSRGVLLGGNLSLLCQLIGTPFMPPPRGKILFIEEKGEPHYRIDRMLTHLRLAGFLAQCAGVVFGDFSECGEASTVIEVLQERTHELGIPVMTGLKVGHGLENMAVPVGVRAILDTETKSMTLAEPSVTDPSISELQ
jgi:muramoyltetrapeptide carboxypeptidase